MSSLKKRRPATRPKPRFLLDGGALPDQSELQVVTNAIYAALEYSPLMVAPRDDNIYARVAREVQDRFWSDIYVERPEIRQTILTLETGQLVLITGERGTGKSTAVQSIVQEHLGKREGPDDSRSPRMNPNVVPYVLDANFFTAELEDVESAERVVRTKISQFLDEQIEDRGAWLGYLCMTHEAFARFRMSVDRDDLRGNPDDWRSLAELSDYREVVDDGIAKFTDASVRNQLRAQLEFIGEYTDLEPLLILDNLDQFNNEIVNSCGEVLATVLQASPHRIRTAIAVRPENADTLQSAIDTAVKPNRISMMQRPLTPNRYEKPPIDVTLAFLEKRLAVLREPEMIEAILEAVDREKASQLAETMSKSDVVDFLNSVIELLDLMIYDLFRIDEDDEELRKENWEFARAFHSWHNGSLRECGLSLTVFASDILQNKNHMYELRDLLGAVIKSREDESPVRRRQLRRMAKSLLYRHLLFWGAPDGEETEPQKHVMVFDAEEESTDPPIHFLRLRILQFLAHRGRYRATVNNIRHEFSKLGVEDRRVDDSLRKLAQKRTQDDIGLLRIDGVVDLDNGETLPDSTMVQLLDAGRFLVDKLYITTEYLFWSAVNSPAYDPPELPRKVTSAHIRDDALRTEVATSFLEHYLVDKFCDEHPYLRGFDRNWTIRRIRQRLMLYKSMFGFERGNWFLDRVMGNVGAFIPNRDPQRKFAAAQAAIDRIGELARSLDRMMLPTASD